MFYFNFFKIGDNYLFSKNCSLFHFIFLKLFLKTYDQIMLKNFKYNFCFEKQKSIFKSHSQIDS